VTRVAAVDCGTNSIRLLVADVSLATGQLTKADLHREMRVVRLGEGVDRTGELAPAALERTRLALVDYAATARELEVERTRLVATSATRDARNRHLFADLVQEVLGVVPEVVSGQEEAALSFLGATAGLEGACPPYLVIDIGGGSTEVVLGTREVEASCSVDIGCVRLTERHLRSDPPTAREVEAARADAEAALAVVQQSVPVERAATALGLAGTVTTVAAMALELPEYQAAAIHLSRISLEEVQAVTHRLLAMTRAERAQVPAMHPGRVDVIGAGALVLLTAMERFGLSEVLVSEADILDGIALSLA
jgi:exopolyphosphatase/guanosine-5'-triphosphate,3'-diphosphate pyrophosphatase